MIPGLHAVRHILNFMLNRRGHRNLAGNPNNMKGQRIGSEVEAGIGGLGSLGDINPFGI